MTCLEAPVTGSCVASVGAITSIVLENNHLCISGVSSAIKVSAENAVARRILHLEPQPQTQPRTFELRLPFDPSETRVTFGTADSPKLLILPKFSRLEVIWGNMRLVPSFAWALVRATPAALRWFRHQDPSARVEVRDLLGLAPLSEALQLDTSLFQETEAAKHDDTATSPSFVIIMPVFNALEVTKQALDRVAHHTAEPWRMVLVEDCSTDGQVLPYLREWASSQGEHVTLIENPQNLGFIGAVNLGLKHALELLQDEPADGGAAVVLLNSDALVPKNWTPRLLAPIAADASVASVTPMSNDAELMTVPTICARHTLAEGIGDVLDKAAASLPQSAYMNAISQGAADMPTGVGFCMALAVSFLRQVPQLDTAFGMGYGEEVDWCQKAVERGGRHVAQPRLFVEHRGGASFGSEAKQKLIAKNGALISQRYPRFDAQVQDFIADDPLLTARLALGLTWLSAEAEALGAPWVPVYLGHSMGGGAELYLQRRIARDIRTQKGAVVLRVGGTLRWQVELHSAAGVTRGGTDSSAFLSQLLSLLPTRRIIYSCGVGDRSPIDLPTALLDLGRDSTGGLEVLFHDFFPLSPSYTLLASDGSWQGVPDIDCSDKAHHARRRDGSSIDLRTWRASWGALLSKAEKIEVFSQNSRSLVTQAYPELSDQIVVVPHALLHPVPLVEQNSASRKTPVIGVLGNIGEHKGSAVLARLSKRLRKTGAARLVLVGNLDPSYKLASPAIVHGDYAISDIPDLVIKYGISCWLIPSIWPETFSFTTHEALATGLPVMAFDIGAQGDLVANASNGYVLPLDTGVPDLDKMLEQVAIISEERSKA